MQIRIETIFRTIRQVGLILAPVALMAQAELPVPPEPASEPFVAQSAPPPPPPPPAPLGAGQKEAFAMLAGSRSFLGVGVKEIDTERAKTLNLKDEYGVEVTKVEDESPALKAGLKVGDVVLEYNGQRVEGTEQFVRLVRETPAGRSVKLLISRGGSAMTLSPVIAVRKAPQVFAVGPDKAFRVDVPPIDVMIPDIPKAMMSWRSSMLGVEAESLADSQLAGYFGVKDGVLVRSVMKDTPAEKAGIKAGDVLVKVDESKVTAPRDVTSAMRLARSASKKSFPVVLMRDKKETTLTVTLDDEPASRHTVVPRTERISIKDMRL